ncbi:hypothetical protein [Psychrobacillus sp. OK032]|uniref:hypothetical protein n=1 Tax=Psychrobacillus sp. OK032 TaxID=1884358 RepID=UPI0008B2FA40|nr:hypothetical protein [Psychrobacillus sp. OK032]SES44919.1 hypothetical protein SAMN05518872_11617 [Psychrobacillus sp. OK032]
MHLTIIEIEANIHYPTIDDYPDGYNREYELAFSVCEVDYEWWWEGPQEFGNWYEAGIEDGHYEGSEDSY